jgi:hypothetical protein
MTWTREKQQQYECHAAALRELEHDRAKALDVLRNIFSEFDMSGGADEYAMQQLIIRADRIRDALEPFDSGIRESKA